MNVYKIIPAAWFPDPRRSWQQADKYIDFFIIWKINWKKSPLIWAPLMRMSPHNSTYFKTQRQVGTHLINNKQCRVTTGPFSRMNISIDEDSWLVRVGDRETDLEMHLVLTSGLQLFMRITINYCKTICLHSCVALFSILHVYTALKRSTLSAHSDHLCEHTRNDELDGIAYLQSFDRPSIMCDAESYDLRYGRVVELDRAHVSDLE